MAILQVLLLAAQAACPAAAPSTQTTALHAAVHAANPPCVDRALQAGADKLTPDADGRSALDLAARIPDRKTREQIVLLLLRQGAKTPQVPVPTLSSAALRGETDLAAMLLQLGAKPDTPDAQGRTPLQAACLKGNVAIVRLLLQYKANPNLPDKSGTWPLHDAALAGEPEVIRLLAAAGANVRAVSRESGESALHIAASWGKAEAVRALLAAGADKTARDGRGRTPLQSAVAAEQRETAVLLR